MEEDFLVKPNGNLPPFIQSSYIEKRLIDRRQIWAANRFWMEIENLKSKRYGNKGHHHWYTLYFMMNVFQVMIKTVGLYKKGVENAKDLLFRTIPWHFPNLPDAFEAFTILQLSDLHLDGMKDIEKSVLNVLNNQEVDLCVLTGDYRTKLHGVNRKIMDKLEYLIKGIKSKHGFFGVLGNHDDCHMVNPMEKMGVHMLINGSWIIKKGEDQIRLIGTDDVHYYYTDQALHALEHADADFSIALIHSPELYDVAAEMGIDFYLCGHTHGGQICLPGGIPILKHLDRGRKYYQGDWSYKKMQGFTHTGIGTSGIPVRFNTRGEVVIHRLHVKQTR